MIILGSRAKTIFEIWYGAKLYKETIILKTMIVAFSKFSLRETKGRGWSVTQAAPLILVLSFCYHVKLRHYKLDSVRFLYCFSSLD